MLCRIFRCIKSISSTFLSSQDTSKTQKCIKKESASETSYKVQENRSHLQTTGLNFQQSKCVRDSSLVQGECRLSDCSLSPDRPYVETSLSVPLHPTKRPASNPPPISNQATKGNIIMVYMAYSLPFVLIISIRGRLH